MELLVAAHLPHGMHGSTQRLHSDGNILLVDDLPDWVGLRVVVKGDTLFLAVGLLEANLTTAGAEFNSALVIVGILLDED